MALVWSPAVTTEKTVTFDQGKAGLGGTCGLWTDWPLLHLCWPDFDLSGAGPFATTSHQPSTAATSAADSKLVLTAQRGSYGLLTSGSRCSN